MNLFRILDCKTESHSNACLHHSNKSSVQRCIRSSHPKSKCTTIANIIIKGTTYIVRHSLAFLVFFSSPIRTKGFQASLPTSHNRRHAIKSSACACQRNCVISQTVNIKTFPGGDNVSPLGGYSERTRAHVKCTAGEKYRNGGTPGRKNCASSACYILRWAYECSVTPPISTRRRVLWLEGLINRNVRTANALGWPASVCLWKLRRRSAFRY